MTQKERSLLVIKAIIKEGAETKGIEPEYLLDKIDACLNLIRPEVLLSESARKIYDKAVEGLRKKGKII